MSDQLLLAVWDRGRHRDALTRALLLASAALECRHPDPEALTIGERDAAILKLRAATFGTQLEGTADCPCCGERLEFDFDGAALVDQLRPPPAREFAISCGWRFRLPECRDLHAMAAAANVDEAARRLLQRCRVDAAGPAAAGDAECSDELIAEIEAHISALDIGADLRIAFHCPHCSHEWSDRLDIAAWFWDELELRAQRLLDEVHCLAAAYGWSETQILALGDQRRRAYLERCLS